MKNEDATFFDSLSGKDVTKALSNIVGEYVLEECRHLREQAFEEGRHEAFTLLTNYMKSLGISAEVIARKLEMTDAEFFKYVENE